MEKQEYLNLVKKVLGEKAEIVRPVVGGMMNLSFLVKDKNNKQYILYIPTEQANEMVDRKLEKEHQRIAYELGITSKNVYFDTETGIKINEYIEGTSIDHTEEFDYDKIAQLFKKLHSSIMLSRIDYAPFTRFEEIYEKEALSFNNEPSQIYKELRDFLFSKRDYLESQRLVFSHNDAQRSNIVKDESGNYYFIDFEFVGNNDEIYDIAAFGNGKVSEGRKLLEKYFNDNPSQDEIKRFYLWRIYISLQWYNVAITKHYRGEGEKHGFNFLDVANHFLANAVSAHDGYRLEIKEKEVEDDTIKLIITTLDKVRHFLRKDGGDCQFVSYSDGVVYVRLHGACQDCSYAYQDVKDLIEVILQEEVPGVVEVRLAD